MHHAKPVKIIVGLLTVAILALVLSAQAGPDARQPIAWIGKQPIYEEDLIPSIAGQLLQLQNQAYELKISALTNLVNQRLLEAAANSKGLSVDAFLEQTVDRNMPPWNSGELEGYYLAQKDRFHRPLSEIPADVERSFIQAKRQQARQEYVDHLREKAGFSIALSRPRTQATVDLSRVKGNPDAPVTIVEFADFQCPYCREAQQTLNALIAKYKDALRLGYRDFPVRQIHQQAQLAAEASRCAAEQGKFWEFHDSLYANQARLDLESLRDNALKAGVERIQFESCIATGKYKSAVESDLQLGAASGVTGTPAFLINGMLLTGSQPLSAFEKLIDAELAATASNRRPTSGSQSADRSQLQK